MDRYHPPAAGSAAPWPHSGWPSRSGRAGRQQHGQSQDAKAPTADGNEWVAFDPLVGAPMKAQTLNMISNIRLANTSTARGDVHRHLRAPGAPRSPHDLLGRAPAGASESCTSLGRSSSGFVDGYIQVRGSQALLVGGHIDLPVQDYELPRATRLGSSSSTGDRAATAVRLAAGLSSEARQRMRHRADDPLTLHPLEPKEQFPCLEASPSRWPRSAPSRRRLRLGRRAARHPGVTPEKAKTLVERTADVKLTAVAIPEEAREQGLRASYSNAPTAVKDKQVVALFVMKDARVADKVSEMVRELGAQVGADDRQRRGHGRLRGRRVRSRCRAGEGGRGAVAVENVTIHLPTTNGSPYAQSHQCPCGCSSRRARLAGLCPRPGGLSRPRPTPATS